MEWPLDWLWSLVGWAGTLAAPVLLEHPLRWVKSLVWSVLGADEL